MDLFGKDKLFKYAKKDKNLQKEINAFVEKFEKARWQKSSDIQEDFPDVDLISKEAYIFNIKSSRTLIVIFFSDNEAEIAWAGNHNDYDRLFNNKKTILRYLKDRGFIN